MKTKTNIKLGSSRIESVLNGLLVAVFVGSVVWAATAPLLSPLATSV